MLTIKNKNGTKEFNTSFIAKPGSGNSIIARFTDDRPIHEIAMDFYEPFIIKADEEDISLFSILQRISRADNNVIDVTLVK